MGDCDPVLEARRLLKHQALSNRYNRSTVLSAKQNKHRTKPAKKPRALVAVTLFSLVSLFFLVGGLEVVAAKREIIGPMVEGYWDRECTVKIADIDWGKIEAGSSKSVVVYIKNLGKKAVTLEMDARDWKPQAASKHLSFEWDYSGESLEANEILAITITLSVSNDARCLEDFRCKVFIKGRETNTHANSNNKGKGKTKQ